MNLGLAISYPVIIKSDGYNDSDTRKGVGSAVDKYPPASNRVFGKRNSSLKDVIKRYLIGCEG